MRSRSPWSFSTGCRGAVWALASLAACLGCGAAGESVEFRAGRRNGHPILTINGATVYLEHIRTPGDDHERLLTGSVLVSGKGATSQGRSVVNDLVLEFEYSAGVTKLDFNGQTMLLREGGRRLRIGASEFEIGASPLTIVVRREGRAEIAPLPPPRVN